MNSKRAMLALVAVGAIALAVNLGAGMATGLTKPMISDALYFRQLAESLADGQGYVIKDSFWPGQPSMRRMPGWPAAVMLGLKLAPGASPDLVMRVLALLLNTSIALLVAAITLRLFGSSLSAFLAGAYCAVHPTALYESLTGMSEPLFIVLAAAGILAALSKRPSLLVLGGLLMGFACLVRANYVLFLPLSLAGAGVYFLARRRWPERRHLVAVFLLSVLCALPPTLWAARNARLTGHFPVFSTLRGQTYYGGNNAVVMDDFEYWGYWIFPDKIPGETPMRQLAATMDEYETDTYYFEKGQAFVRENRTRMPKLWFGKLVRAYLPIPWKPSVGSLAVSAYRWLLFASVLVGAWLARHRLDPLYLLILSAMTVTSIITVVGFWGCARFALAIEPFFMPLAGVAAASLLHTATSVNRRLGAKGTADERR